MLLGVLFSSSILFALVFSKDLQPFCDGLLEPSVLSVDKPLEDIQARRGDSVLLSCAFYGAPQPSIIWYHKGRRVDNHPAAHYETLLNADQLGQSVVESTFRIDCLDEKSAGEYFCEASSPCTKSVVSAAKVSIISEGPVPRPRCPPKPSPSPPFISAFTASRIELPSRVTQLMCRVSGNPVPKTRWMRIEEDESMTSIAGSPSYMHLSNGDLLIVGDEDTITESFRCIAESPLGVAHQDTTVVYMSP